MRNSQAPLSRYRALLSTLGITIVGGLLTFVVAESNLYKWIMNYLCTLISIPFWLFASLALLASSGGFLLLKLLSTRSSRIRRPSAPLAVRVSPLPVPEGIQRTFRSYNSFVDYLVEEILKRYGEHPNIRFWVAISGPRQSGKTTLAAALISRLKPKIENVVSFKEDDFYYARKDRDTWFESDPGRCSDQKQWLRWDQIKKWFEDFHTKTGDFTLTDLYDLSNGRVHLLRKITVMDNTLFVYEGQFLEDINYYPKGFDFLVRLAINFEVSLERSLEKDSKRGLNELRIHLLDSIVYRPALGVHTLLFHPERKSDLVVDTTDFSRPLILRYERVT